MKKKPNMYKLSVKQWNPFVGCEHHCSYCVSSFQRQLKRWAKGKCDGCYRFIPHTHPERLGQRLPKTGYMQFIFTCSNGDVAFCPIDSLLAIVARIEAEPDKTFLIQSKDPKTFNRIEFPSNVILGTTIETNRDDLYEGISEAPPPSQRYKDFLKVDHLLKMVTIEPVIDFDVDVMVKWIENINPCMVWIGYDSKKNYLPEPELERVRALHWELAKRGYYPIGMPLIKKVPIVETQFLTFRELAERQVKEKLDKQIEKFAKVMVKIDTVTEEAKRKALRYRISDQERNLNKVESLAKELGIDVSNEVALLSSLIGEAIQKLEAI